ncbi:hypothetical protein [Lentzea sp. HUAS12]|uniref:hypothetical protein n=1 Tax=Lentzea sp. HUAS12 TaxID=2951806 RepID=UPI0020A1F605|nr:hypothetical protein [Lentzea sp. HUAS12]USX49463.1 hypothetical protein ND450_29035 [Lentzea sp. HUAS12]
MVEEDLRERLARLIVDALEVGNGKMEQDTINALFRAFGVDFASLADPRGPSRKFNKRGAAAKRLASAAPSAEALISKLIQCGGWIVDMVEEVYRRLASHAATTTGTSEAIRLESSEVNTGHLTISPAFIEQLRHLERVLRSVDIINVDTEAIKEFLGWDNWEFYGHFPLDSRESLRLADSILRLSSMAPDVSARAASDPAWCSVDDAMQRAKEAADELIDHAERALRGQMAVKDLEVVNVDLTDVPRSIVLPRNWPAGSAMNSLAGFVLMYRLDLYELDVVRRRESLSCDALALAQWLESVAESCRRASIWLNDEVFRREDSIDVWQWVDAIREFLNLPLWGQRDLLYEIWVLCETLGACEQAGWEVELTGLHDGNVWVLPRNRGDAPVAKLRYGADPTIVLDVWRERHRKVESREFSPDVTVSTPEPNSRELLVVEAKDRYGMALGRPSLDGQAHPPRRNEKAALSVAEKYAAGLRPVVTWVCNHCEIVPKVDPKKNYGDAWNLIHLAANFRPSHVPAVFAKTVAYALRPYHVP